MNIEHVALNVADPTAMADWYSQHLGMRVVRSFDAPTYARFLADEAGRVVLEIYHQTKAPVPDYLAMHPMVFHIAWVVANIRDTCDRLLAAGATMADDVATTASGDELAMLRDPWGVPLQLVKRARPLLEKK
jgi:glyoxylase I family protein